MADPEINNLKVTIRSRQGLVYEGRLSAISSVNSVGPFDVLPRHTNFVSLILQKLTLRKPDGKIEVINAESGIMLVENNEVKVFLGVSKV